MEYRDERDALRGRVDSLEDQLATAKREIEASRGDDRDEQVRALEQQVLEARRVLDRLERELSNVRAPRPKAGSTAPILGVVVALGVAGVIGALLVLRSPPRPPPVVAVTVPPVPPPPPPPEPATVAPAPTVAAPEPPARTIAVTWTARVKHATGLPLGPGSTCAVEADLTTGKDGIGFRDLRVTCGAKTVYDSTAPLNGMSSLRTASEEQQGKEPGTYVYSALYEDKGPRSGTRAEISLDSSARAASVWSDSAPAYRIELDVPTQSAPVRGEALLEGTNKALRATARVTGIAGPAPVKAGAQCTVRSIPVAPDSCVTHVECGSVVLYGAGSAGYSPCVVTDRVQSAEDDQTTPHGGDPAMHLDAAERSVVVRDDTAGEWRVTLALDPTPR